uniref:Uncharacterized protein n=1 Tax=Elaeophora elaphi TaxID=1147741 RepID=A0A0R3RNN4_9BILA
MNATPIDFNRTGNGPVANSTPKTESSKSDYPANNAEKPVIVEQAKHVSKRRKTKYGSYKTLNDDAYNSDLDDLCDPDFYLTYTSQATMPITSNAIESGKINGDLNRKSGNESSFVNNSTAATAGAATGGATAKMNEPNLRSIGEPEIPGKNTFYQ